jgi:hypothetical protein
MLGVREHTGLTGSPKTRSPKRPPTTRNSAGDELIAKVPTYVSRVWPLLKFAKMAGPKFNMGRV